MLLNILSVVGNDKYIEHPQLGSVSCSGFYEAFKKCHKLLENGGNVAIQCRSLYEISNMPPIESLIIRSELL
jgi:hypothetical protein